MSWAEATAKPANKAAVLSNSCFLMEWSSSSSRFPPRAPMRVDGDSGDNDVTSAQFRPRARFHCGRSSLISVDFVEPNFSERSLEIRALVQRKIIGRFHPRNNRSSFRAASAPAPKKQRQRPAPRHWNPTIPRPQIASVTTEPRRRLTKFQYASRAESPRWPTGRATLCGLRDFKRAKSKLRANPIGPNPWHAVRLFRQDAHSPWRYAASLP
jgi:hypothetical protein